MLLILLKACDPAIGLWSQPGWPPPISPVFFLLNAEKSTQLFHKRQVTAVVDSLFISKFPLDSQKFHFNCIDPLQDFFFTLT